MCITVKRVRDCSVTGEFDTLADGKIAAQIELVCPLYKSIRARNENGWREMVALHVAHRLHVATKAEGVGGKEGAVSAESFAQVGSRSYAVAAQPASGGEDWGRSPYGPTYLQYYNSMPPALRALVK